MSLHRFMDAREFARALDKLHAYHGGHVGDGLLEELEEARLVLPRLRLRWPDPVARRFWLLSRESDDYALKLPTEPDGPRWDAAVDLDYALDRWRNHIVYGHSPHPFDDPEPRFAQFLENPATTPFSRWKDLRVDVSNNHYEVLYAGNSECFYSSWQILLAAEVADMGVHFRVNLAEGNNGEEAWQAVREGRRPGGRANYAFSPIYALQDFEKHVKALDAVVWYEEESERALVNILKHQSGGRYRLSEEESERYHQARDASAAAAGARFSVGVGDLIALCIFLSKQWSAWNREGRPLIADAYKDFLGVVVVMARRLGKLSYAQIRDRIGRQGGWSEPMLDVIWPDWAKKEKERAAFTLKGFITRDGTYPITAEDIDAFVEFLGTNNLEAFFWRLRSFEDHIFRGNEFALQGMKSDVEGMAVVVEQAVRALGGQGRQLYEVFKHLWRDPGVLALLKRDDVTRLARQAALAQNWSSLKAAIQALQKEGESGKIAADLVLAHRIRGGVHHTLPENDEAELESFFMTLMRAAALTFAENARHAAASKQAAARSA